MFKVSQVHVLCYDKLGLHQKHNDGKDDEGKASHTYSLILPTFSIRSRKRGSFIIAGINPDNCYLFLIAAVQSCHKHLLDLAENLFGRP